MASGANVQHESYYIAQPLIARSMELVISLTALNRHQLL